MAMAVGGAGDGDPEVMIDINTTPLIDVMLVLIIMSSRCQCAAPGRWRRWLCRARAAARLVRGGP